MAEQCEGCLGYKDEAEKFAYLCEECQGKAASYDINTLERKELAKAIQKVLPKLNELNPLPTEQFAVGEIYGTLRAALENCRFKTEEPVKEL